MRLTFISPFSHQTTLFKGMSIGVIAILLAAALFLAQPVGHVFADACTTVQDGVWSDPSTWGGACGSVPDSADDVTLMHVVTLDTNQPTGSLTIGDGGELTFTAPVTLTINGNFEVAAGGAFHTAILDPGTGEIVDGGTVVFDSGAQTITTNGVWVDFYNLTKFVDAPGQSLSIDPAVAGDGGIHVFNLLTLKGSATNALVLQSTVGDSAWQIWPEGTVDVDYVTVSDSENVSLTVFPITVAHGTDSGNNIGWSIASSPAVLLESDFAGKVAPQHAYVTFSATITPTNVTGTVAFLQNGTEIQDCAARPIVNGIASCKTDDLPKGALSITAVYSGDVSNLPATSNTVLQDVGNPIVVTLASLTNPSKFGSATTFEVTFSPVQTTGTVTFKDGSDVISGCSAVAVSANKALCSPTSLSVGPHTIHAELNPGDIHSNEITHVVKNMSSVLLETSGSPSQFGKPVTLTGTVFSPTDATGSMTFMDGSLPIAGCENLPIDSNRQAVCNTAALKAGLHSLSVVYSGNATTFGLSPSPVTHTVDYARFFFPLLSK